MYKTLENTQVLWYNPFRYSEGHHTHILYQIIQKIPYFILLNIKLNINE